MAIRIAPGILLLLLSSLLSIFYLVAVSAAGKSNNDAPPLVVLPLRRQISTLAGTKVRHFILFKHVLLLYDAKI